MSVTASGDPRLETMFGGGSFSEASARPIVAVGRRRVPTWAYVAAAAFAALLLFVMLEARRTASAPSGTGAKTSTFATEPPPPLVLAPASGPPVSQPALVAPVQPFPPTSFRPGATGAPAFGPDQAARTSTPPLRSSAPPFGGQQGGSAMVIDSSGPPPSAFPPNAGMTPSGAMSGAMPIGGAATRVRASTLANPSYTVAQGVLIPAVLETAFHSTAAGFARAIVSRDVRSFDGTRVLIPRGSRLIGEYRGNVQPGQTRALINWTRLIRGDGVTLSLNSPAVDPLGRGGVRARVNTHLLERVTDSVLQSTIGMAGNLLRSSRNNVIITSPGGAGAGALAQDAGASGDSLRTLSVPAGTSISIFVAQDLEFEEGMGVP